ncbi:DNA polymerase I [Chamaesiphon sp. VAR_48_metabat_135_sub]|uniref:DNA polymerase I n=1 Tax=Chamaesiphon sp. VAR_48_metabat_135_sub TaxID=2964699 RepID=UPI00286A2D4D|nr:DNA polymerase I [Chamaesiphon sp. VAR_48_metabat_135_sub]
MSPTPLLILVDGHSLAYRSYYAYAKSKSGGLMTSAGVPTSICFGFVKALVEIINSQKPDSMAIAFDLRQPTFRHEADDNYKADRVETPEDFTIDIQNLYLLLTALNLPTITAPGYEADDILGTLAGRGSRAGYQVKILSGDKDMFQLVNDRDRVSVLYLSSAYSPGGQPGTTEMNEQGVIDKMGVRANQIIDYKALCGDKSDSIPGVRGIGDKTAVKLLTEYQDLKTVYDRVDEIPGATGKRLVAGKEDADHSQYLARIITDVPLDLELKSTKLTGFDFGQVQPLLQTLELHRFNKDIEKLHEAFGGVTIPDAIPDSQESVSLIAPDDGSDDLWFFSAEDTDKFQLSRQCPIQPQIIDSSEKLQALITNLQQYTDPNRPIAWDTETTDLEPRNAKLVGIGCCWGEETNSVAYIPVGHETGDNLDLELVLNSLKPILESATYPKVLQNAKFDRLVFKNQGVNLQGVVFDTMLASYVLNPDSSHNLTDLSSRYLGIVPQSYTELVAKGQTIANISIPLVAEYCGMDVWGTCRLHSLLKAELAAAPKLLALLQEIEQPLEPILAEMEDRGINIDAEYLQTLSVILAKDLDRIEAETYALAGEKFNLGSPKQLAQILFEKLELDTKGIRQTKSGYSTDVNTLEKLQGKHEVVDLILQHRTFSKLKSTYVDALPALIHPKTGRVHTDFNQAVTSTGRLSSSHPNLQNIPIRTEFSRQIRRAFIPAPGWILAAVDYSQIELRILAHLSQEPVLITAYNQNEDIHTVTAKLLFESDTVTSEQRRMGKIINFGVVYGMGAAKFGRETGVKTSEAKIFIEKFYERYPGIFDYLERVKREAIALGYVETVCGRRRYFKFESGKLRGLKGSDPNQINLEDLGNLGQLDAGHLRAAANAPIQGSSADIIKLAMIKIDKLLEQYQAKMLLQVHDELVLEIPLDEWAELQPKIKATMENAIDLSVPMVAEIGSGANWMEAK